jgi:predicted RNA binding protein YcfA (HicA-like mRNA interferase family)
VTKLPAVSGTTEVVRPLERAGFVQAGVKGSHCKLRSHERNLTVIVPLHRGALPQGTLASILRQAKMTADDLHLLL